VDNEPSRRDTNFMTTVVMLLVRHSHGQGLSPCQPGEENAGPFSGFFAPYQTRIRWRPWHDQVQRLDNSRFL